MIKAIRGATTIELNTKEQIEQRTLELYRELNAANKIKDAIYIHITTTADITAYYPATALRLSGVSIPLFSSLEPPISEGLELTIRMLILAKVKAARHIYLHKAKGLIDKQNKENEQ